MKTPNFKAPEMKVPKPVTDLVADLRQRGLLPVAVALVVAIFAVPIVLSSGSEAPPPKPAGAAVNAAAAAPEAQSLVVAEGENLRDYRKRLAHDVAHDPFVQKFAAPDVAAGTSAGGDTGGTVTGTSVGGDSNAASTTTSGSGKKSKKHQGSSSGSKPDSQYVTWEVDAWTGPSGDLKLREGVQRYTPLPYDTKPALVFLGVTNDNNKALFMVSSSVLTLSGDGVCLLGIGHCDMLALAPGKSASFVFAPDGLTYGLKVVRINRVVRNASGN